MQSQATKKCIWCCRTGNVTFNKKAHTIPQNLGGNEICKNVCDECNLFFGTHYKGSPSVEATIKETFNISRAKFLAVDNKIGKNKPMTKFSSEYFNLNLKKHLLTLKPKYKLQKGFQEKIGRQIKKGLYKIFLEEIERQTGDGLNPKYDFIREFARYDLGDYPVFYFERRLGMILMAKNWAVTPPFYITQEGQLGYLVNEPYFFEFEFLGHVFGIATSKIWNVGYDNYIEKTKKAKMQFFRGYRVVNAFNDIDISLCVLDEIVRPIDKSCLF